MEHAGIARSRGEWIWAAVRIIKTPPPPHPLLSHTQIHIRPLHAPLNSLLEVKCRSSCAAALSRFLLFFCSVILIPVKQLSSLHPWVHFWCAGKKKCDSLHKYEIKDYPQLFSLHVSSQEIGHVWCLFSSFTVSLDCVVLLLLFVLISYCGAELVSFIFTYLVN